MRSLLCAFLLMLFLYPASHLANAGQGQPHPPGPKPKVDESELIAELIQSQQQQNAAYQAALGKMGALANPANLGAIQTFSHQIMHHPNRNKVIYAEIALFFIFLFFRGWRLSKLSSSNWIRGITVRIWTTGVYLAIGILGIPWYFFGQTYTKPLLTLARSFY